MNKKLLIQIKPWQYSCSDGCCYESDSAILVNGEKVTDYGEQQHILLSSILNHLGYDVEIKGYNLEGECDWEHYSIAEETEETYE